jgi:hypothetical protein
LFRGVRQAEQARQRDQLPRDGQRLVGGDPPDQVVVSLVAVGVFDRELGLAHPAKAVERLGLDDRSGCAGCQLAGELAQ